MSLGAAGSWELCPGREASGQGPTPVSLHASLAHFPPWSGTESASESV